jgi:hypothetical protein
MTLLFFNVGEDTGLFTSLGETTQRLFEGLSGTYDYACHDIVFTSFRVWSECGVFSFLVSPMYEDQIPYVKTK